MTGHDWVTHGYAYLHGYRNGYSDAGDQADLTARRLVANTETAEARKALSQSAAEFLSVPRVKARPTPHNTAATAQPTLEQFLDGLRRGGILQDQQRIAA